MTERVIGHKVASHLYRITDSTGSKTRLEKHSPKNYDASKLCTCNSDSSTSATLMNGCPFKGSNIVFQLEDPVHFPCTGWMKTTSQLDVEVN